MKKVFQTRYGKEEGNCFQAALASLFELKFEEVPDFCNIYSTETDEWYEKFVEWLNVKGYSSLPVDADDLDRPNYKDCFLLVTGKNAKGVNHCVIYLNGKIAHNPNKECKGIKPKTIDLIFPLNPVLKLKEQNYERKTRRKRKYKCTNRSTEFQRELPEYEGNTRKQQKVCDESYKASRLQE